MHEQSKTLYIPLYVKAMVSSRRIILHDPKAEEIWTKEGFKLKGRAKSKWLAYFLTMRARVFDDWIRMQALNKRDATVLHIGAGLDSRVLRVDVANNWYDIDLEDVIETRKQYYEETDKYHMISGDIRDTSFLDKLDIAGEAIVILEGVSMYLTQEELCNLFEALEEKFCNVIALVDVYTLKGAKLSKYRNPINTTSKIKVYGVEHPNVPIRNTSIRFLAEHSMTPTYLVDQLKGLDRRIFRSLYAGKIAKKMYKLYEYKKEI